MKGFIVFVSLLISTIAVAEDRQAILARIAPIGKVDVEQKAVTSVKSEALSGKQVYDISCMACHETGAAGAPKLNDKNAWAPRVKQGKKTLIKHVVEGYKLMPAKGGCMQCSDDDIVAAVNYMLKQANP